jgi:hypothetical protein
LLINLLDWTYFLVFLKYLNDSKFNFSYIFFGWSHSSTWWFGTIRRIIAIGWILIFMQNYFFFCVLILRLLFVFFNNELFPLSLNYWLSNIINFSLKIKQILKFLINLTLVDHLSLKLINMHQNWRPFEGHQLNFKALLLTFFVVKLKILFGGIVF